MFWVLTVVSVFLLILLYLLFAPFFFEADSSKGLLRVRFHKLASARLLPMDGSLRMELKIAGYRKVIDFFALKGKKNKLHKEKKKKRKRWKATPSRILSVLKSFKVNQCVLSIDSGSAYANAMLFPAFYWLGKWSGKEIRINFTGEEEIILQLENNLARILRAFFLKQSKLQSNDQS